MTAEEDKIYVVDFYKFICENMANFKNVFEAWEAFKKEKRK